MKKSSLSVAITLVLFCSLILVNNMEVEGATQRVLIEEDFERYAVATFPSAGGWELWADGAGATSQIIDDQVSASPTKSLQLIGLDGWAAYPAIRFESDSQIIGYEVNVRVEETRVGARDSARVAFCSKVSSTILREYAAVFFRDDCSINSGGKVLQSYVAGSWYNVKSIVNRVSETYSVWIDGVLLGEDLDVTTTTADIATYPSRFIEGFSVSQCFNGVKIYFDDVKVFEVTEPLKPELGLTPSVGFAATTLTGSGFASNSKITVTWNGIVIPTVPYSLVTGAHGRFAAIISVLNQTSSGNYTLRVVDDEGNEAEAIFIVDFSGLVADLNQTSSNGDFGGEIHGGDEEGALAGFLGSSSWTFFQLFTVMTLFSFVIYVNRHRARTFVNKLRVYIQKIDKQSL